MKQNEKILSTKEVAKFIGRSNSAVRQLAYRKKLNPRKALDGKNYYLQSEVLVFMGLGHAN